MLFHPRSKLYERASVVITTDLSFSEWAVRRRPRTVTLHGLDLKSTGVRIAARDPDPQTAEIHIRMALMNRFNALGSAEIVHLV